MLPFLLNHLPFKVVKVAPKCSLQLGRNVYPSHAAVLQVVGRTRAAGACIGPVYPSFQRYQSKAEPSSIVQHVGGVQTTKGDTERRASTGGSKGVSARSNAFPQNLDFPLNVDSHIM